MLMKASMLCSNDGEILHIFNTWIGDSSGSCYITNNKIFLFDITIIKKSVQ